MSPLRFGRSGNGGGGGGDGSANVRTVARAGLSLRNFVDLLLPTRPDVGLAVAPGPVTVTSPVSGGAAVTTTATATASTTARGGSRVATSAVAAPVVPVQAGGARLGRFRVDWSRDAGASGAVQTSLGGRSDWQNPTNAQGQRNGTVSTISGSALGPRGGALLFAFADFAGKDALTITSVQVRFYVSQSGTILNNGNLRLVATPGWVAAQSETITSNVDNLVAPRVFTFAVPAAASNMNSFTARVEFEAGIAETFSAQVDSVQLVVSGFLQETPA